MTNGPIYAPPRITFDTRLEDELARIRTLPAVPEPTPESEPPPNPFEDYQREITGSGVRITYRSRVAHILLDVLRFMTWVLGTLSAAYMLLFASGFSWPTCFLLFVGIAVLGWWGLFLPLPVTHSIEVRQDGLVVDGRLFFLEGFGDNWPSLLMQNDDPNRMVLAGLYGSRYVVFAGVHRFDANSRVPELLAQDLDLAMDQLWGRR